MVMSLIIPEMESRPSNTKDAVISILTTDWPLSLRQIFYKIRKKYSYSSSYQAVYKAVKELRERDVLTEKDKRYMINISWVKEVQSFTDIVETNYYAKEKVHNLSGLSDSKQKEDLIVLNFESIFDAEKYLYYFMKYHLFKSSKDNVCYCTNTEWRPIFYLRSEHNYYTRLIKKGHKFYFLCSGKTKQEDFCGKFYKSLGINFKTTKEHFSNDILIFGDFCINIFIPEDTKIKLKKFMKKKEIGFLTDVLNNKSSVRVIINRDKSLAEGLRKQVIKKF
jgi:hypothetical protein